MSISPYADPYYKRLYAERPRLQELIEREVKGTPGRTIVAGETFPRSKRNDKLTYRVCGDADFSSTLRKIVINSMCNKFVITFEEVEFRPQWKADSRPRQPDDIELWNTRQPTRSRLPTRGEIAPRVIDQRVSSDDLEIVPSNFV